MAYGIQHLLFSGVVVLSLPFCRLLSLSASLLLRYSAASDAAPLVGGYLQTLSVEMVTLPLNLSPLPSCVAEEICDVRYGVVHVCPAPLLGQLEVRKELLEKDGASRQT